jgi:MFS family permease
MADAAGAPTDSTSAKVTAAEALQATKDHFVLISALTVAVGVGLSTTFLASYLSIFDWHLIWFVQYSDIVTFGLVAIGIVTGSFTTLQGLTQLVLSSIDAKITRRQVWAAVLIFLALFLFALVSVIRRGEGYFHVVDGAGTLGMGVFLLVLVARAIEKQQWPSIRHAISIFIIATVTTALFGQWLGFSVKETSLFNQDVDIKGNTMTNVKLVIVMSRHTILLKDGVLYVLPTADISKFRTADKQAKPLIPEESGAEHE